MHDGQTNQSMSKYCGRMFGCNSNPLSRYTSKHAFLNLFVIPRLKLYEPCVVIRILKAVTVRGGVYCRNSVFINILESRAFNSWCKFS
jgi:hypothetical protein